MPACGGTICRSDDPLDLLGREEWRQRSLLPPANRKNGRRKVRGDHSFPEAKAQERAQSRPDQLRERHGAITTVVEQIPTDRQRVESAKAVREALWRNEPSYKGRVNLQRPLAESLVITEMVQIPPNEEISGR